MWAGEGAMAGCGRALVVQLVMWTSAEGAALDLLIALPACVAKLQAATALDSCECAGDSGLEVAALVDNEYVLPGDGFSVLLGYRPHSTRAFG